MLERALSSTLQIAILAWISLQLFEGTALGFSIDKQILDSVPRAEMFNAFHVMHDGQVMIMTELDLLLTIDQYRNLHTNENRVKRKGRRDTKGRWTDCKVYYEITDSLNAEDRKVILEAIDEWMNYTCLNFTESKTANSRILFRDGDGCYSQVGMQDVPQEVVLTQGCRKKGIIAHEIGHAIGWYHEHMRPDRDEFIKINTSVIPASYQRSFQSYTTDVINTYDVPYDYNSLMHYGNDVFPGAITTIDPIFQDKIGQRYGLSFKDIKLANLMYDCASIMGCSPKTCEYGGFVFYKNYKGQGRCECWCDSGNIKDPLVLCKNLKKTPPLLFPLPSTPPTSLTDICFDVREDCNEMREKGMCRTKIALMMSNCAKTCNFCGKGGDLCMDLEKACALMATSGLCTDPGLEKLMTITCRASCGLCPKLPDLCEIQRELLGSENNGVCIGVSPMFAVLLLIPVVLVG